MLFSQLPLRFALLAFVSLLPGCTSAPHYEAIRPVILSKVLPPPPEAGSPADKKDLADVLAAQKQRTPGQAAEAKLDAQLDIFRFRPALGGKFTPDNLPVTVAFFRQVKLDEDVLIEAAKRHYNRPRPFVASAAVHPVVPQPPNASYPSGHAAFAYVNGTLLAKMLPEKKAAIMARAAHYARNRVIGGVHYPTDITAGKEAAAVIVDALLEDAEFRADFGKARAELRAVVLK